MWISRADRSVLADWWFTFDRALLSAMLTLLLIGLALVPAASPAVAIRKGLSAFHFAERQVVFAAVAACGLIAVSMLTPRGIRRLALLLFLASIAAMVLVLVAGNEINGARRWLHVGGLSLQPSEFAKPAFAVIAAWACSESERETDMPALPLAAGVYVLLAVLLVAEPDVGQTLLVTAVWLALLVLSGRPLVWPLGLAGCSAGLLGVAYLLMPHVTARIDRFLAPPTTDTSQLDRAFQSFADGGLFGRGPGEGTIKTLLPDAHTDFVFAVVGEEYGALACIAIILLFALIVLRSLARAAAARDPFIRHAVAALALLIGLQALINMGVNVGLVPAKGMTLPFISAGGSSTIAVAITCGMLLALTRRRSWLEHTRRHVRLNSPESPVKAGARIG